jgi:hypothetical protein
MRADIAVGQRDRRNPNRRMDRRRDLGDRRFRLFAPVRGSPREPFDGFVATLALWIGAEYR